MSTDITAFYYIILCYFSHHRPTGRLTLLHSPFILFFLGRDNDRCSHKSLCWHSSHLSVFAFSSRIVPFFHHFLIPTNRFSFDSHHYNPSYTIHSTSIPSPSYHLSFFTWWRCTFFSATPPTKTWAVSVRRIEGNMERSLGIVQPLLLCSKWTTSFALHHGTASNLLRWCKMFILELLFMINFYYFSIFKIDV